MTEETVEVDGEQWPLDIYREEEDGLLWGEVPILPGCFFSAKDGDIYAAAREAIPIYRDGLVMYTIYCNPNEKPSYLVRQIVVKKGGESWSTDNGSLAESLEEARTKVPEHAGACIARSPEDDQYIVETWM